MNQRRYMEIRNGLDLRTQPHFPIYFGLQTFVLTVVCFTLSLKLSGSPWRFLTIPIISLVMFRNFAFMHEAVHGLISKNRRINHVLGVASGTLCLLSFDSWRQAHIEHHRWSGNIDKDPVAAMIKTFPTFPKRLQMILTFGWKCWMPTLSFLQHTVFWAITLRHVFKTGRHLGETLTAVFPVLFWASLFLTLPLGFTVTILVPSIVFYLIGTEVINAPHHLGLTYFRGETKIQIWEQFKTARTCVYPTWLARFVVLNFNYHTEHHMYPYVPWYHLDKIQPHLRAELRDKYNLDPSFSWIMRNRSRDLGEVFGSQQLSQPNQAKAA